MLPYAAVYVLVASVALWQRVQRVSTAGRVSSSLQLVASVALYSYYV